MQVSDEEALSAPSSPASKSQSRARGSLPPLAGHQPLGPDDDPFANEGRGTPRDTTEGLDQDTLFWSEHSDPYHTQGTGDLSRIGYALGGTRARLGFLFVLPSVSLALGALFI